MTSIEANLRLALHDDVPAIEDIVRAAYTHYISVIGRKLGPMLDDYTVLVANGRVFVAEMNGTAQGILVLIPQDDAMLLDNIAVAPPAQGQGLGKYMLQFAENVSVKRGYSAIRLYTHEMMIENIRLYKRIGYFETHRVEEKGLRRVYMLKRLSIQRIWLES
jgi:ribosomal protein S18 acetylase RimI-like enzyme